MTSVFAGGTGASPCCVIIRGLLLLSLCHSLQCTHFDLKVDFKNCASFFLLQLFLLTAPYLLISYPDTDMQPLLTLFHSSAKKKVWGFKASQSLKLELHKCRSSSAELLLPKELLLLNFSFIADSPRVLGCQVKKQAVTTKGYRTTVRLMLVL